VEHRCRLGAVCRFARKCRLVSQRIPLLETSTHGECTRPQGSVKR